MSLLFFSAGLCFGFFNGFCSRFILKRSIREQNSVFFLAWFSGASYRLASVVLSVVLLKKAGLAAVLAFVLPMIAAQEIFLLIPIKSKSEKIDKKL